MFTEKGTFYFILVQMSMKIMNRQKSGRIDNFQKYPKTIITRHVLL